MSAARGEQAASVGLKEFYTSVRAYTEELCRPLEIEDYIPQPSVDASPIKWNIAHTTWFFEEMVLKRFVPGYKTFDPNFAFLFNSYYNTVGERTARDRRGDLSRPTVKRVFEYRKYVDDEMVRLLSGPVAGTSNADENSLHSFVTLGLNHEQQHQELFLTDLKYTFSVNPTFPAYRDDLLIEEIVETCDPAAIKINGGLYDIGYDGDGFCFDNELSRHKVFLEDLEIDGRLVTNAEYLEFVESGGYRDHRLWHSEGWDWVNSGGIEYPLYWRFDNGEWKQFTLAGLRILSPNAPVCSVSFYEAAAFAEWKGMRLPTEFEWEAAAPQLEWRKRWEWTASSYLPYPGFKKPNGAVGEYNGKFMMNQMVLRGASVATPPGHSRPTYRNFFHPHLQWQFTGIRLAR